MIPSAGHPVKPCNASDAAGALAAAAHTRYDKTTPMAKKKQSFTGAPSIKALTAAFIK
jgi:hypothetical protein